MRFVSPALPLALLFLCCSLQAVPAAQPTVVMPANMTVAPEATATLSVALSTSAPSGGVTITLSSSNPSIVSVWPPSMVIPMEMTTPPRLIPTITGHLAGTATIIAVAPGYTTANMVVQSGSGGNGNPAPGSVSLTPANLTVAKGSTQNLTVVLSGAAPAGGVPVNLSYSDPAVVSAPAAVNVDAGMTTVTVPVTGMTAGSATITATTTNFGTATASVVVSGTGGTPAAPGLIVPASLTLAPGDVREYNIQLATAAPANGVYITATTSDASKVTLSQLSIFIPEGMTSVPRNVTTINAVNSGVATISVSAAGYASVSTQVQVTGNTTPAPGGGTMSFSPSSLSLSASETKLLTLSLSSPAGNGGLAVSLNSSNSSVASVPSAVTVAAGTATYNIQVAGAGAGTASITATAANYGNAAASVTVSSTSVPPSTQPKIVVPATVTLMPGETVPFSVALPSGAGANGVPITITSSDPGIASVSPSTFVIPEGATTARRVETTLRGTSVGSVTITAAASGFGNGSTQVQVTSPAAGGTMTVSPAALSLITGNTQNLTLTLTGTLPPNGLVIYLSSNNTAAATVPASVTLPAHATVITVPVAGAGTGTATITATAANFGNAVATVTVAATPQINLPSNVTLAAGETVNLPVTLSAAALSDTVISLSSSDTSKLTVAPSAFTIQKGMASAPNVTTTISGVNAGTATVIATAPGYTGASKQVVVTSATTPPVLTMGLSPANLSITGLITQNLTLTLSGPASAGGLAVTFKSSNGSIASVPSTLTIPANTNSIAVPVTALATGSTVVTASTAGLQDATATVTVSPVSVGTLTMPGSWSVSPGQSNTLQATLNPAAPASGVTLTFASSDTSKATVTPTTVAVGGGGTSVNVQITGVAAGTANISVSGSGYTGASTPVQVFVATGSGAFDPGVLVINSGVTQTVSLGLGPQSPAGLTVNLVSKDPTIASVPASVVVPANSYQVSVPVTALVAGSTVITATVPGYATSTLNVTVLSFNGVSVEWHGICWVPVVYQGVTYYRHAIDFKLTTPQPVTLQGSLFYTSSNCTGPVDNMNDFGTTTSSTHMIQGFLNYPYPVWPAGSVLFWIGPRTGDGSCAPGSLCSGCLAYSDKTPMCDSLP